MKQMKTARLTVYVLFAALIAGCASTPVVVNKEASTSAIRAAEEVGASNIPTASLYLQLAKEELENAKALAANNNKNQSESMLLRAQSDAELAVALSHGDAYKKEAALALERVGKLQQDNHLPQERK